MGEKFRRWVRNFGDEVSGRREQLEKEKEESEEHKKMRGMREKFRGK